MDDVEDEVLEAAAEVMEAAERINEDPATEGIVEHANVTEKPSEYQQPIDDSQTVHN